MKNIVIGLVIHHYKDMFGTFSAMEKIRGAKDAAFEENVDLLVHIAKKSREFDYKSVDGILFADLFENEELVNKAKRLKIPYLILEYFDEKSPYNCMGIDNKDAVTKVVDKLVKLGHKEIAIVTGKLGAKIGNDRLDGFLEGLRKNNIKQRKDYIIQGDWSKASGQKAFLRLNKLKCLPTAVFVSGDEMALGFIEQAKKHGIRVPKKISIIGFDDIPIASSAAVSLSTVRQPLYEMGKLGIEQLVGLIRKKRKTPLKILLKNSRVILRKTTRKFKAAE